MKFGHVVSSKITLGKNVSLLVIDTFVILVDDKYKDINTVFIYLTFLKQSVLAQNFRSKDNPLDIDVLK